MVDLLVKNKQLPAPEPNEIFVVISHDCDVTNPSLDVEPSLEVLKASLLDLSAKDGSYAWGKNPRYYQFEYEWQDGRRSLCEFSVLDRIRVPREYLTTAKPDQAAVFSPDEIRALALWLARRYVRSAFPDAFVQRTKSATDRLRKSLKSQGSLITAIYVLVEDDELPDDTPYPIVLYGSMRVEDYEDSERRDIAQELLNKVEAALGDCDGIDARASHLKSEAEMSLDDRRRLKRWDFDDLTIRGQPTSDLPPND